MGSWERPEYLVHSLVKSTSKSLVEASDEESEPVRISKALRVTLPDQHHSYYVTESEDSGMKCNSISSISFR